MRVWQTTLGASLALAGLALAGAWVARADEGGPTQRPTTAASQYAYSSPESLFSEGAVVVHYVTRGVDAPPLNDDDQDGVPDYVKAVADTANQALASYAARGFRRPPPDRGGPDGRLDVYVAELQGAGCGFSEPDGPEESQGGYVLVSQLLDRQAQGDTLCGLYQVVSHEVFHVVQFAYPAGTLLPPWVSEGTATAMQLDLYPNVHEQLLVNHYAWGSEESAQTLCRRDPYAAAPFWSAVMELDPHFLPYYLAHAKGPTATDPCGYQELDRLLRSKSRFSLAAAYEQMNVANADLLPSARRLRVQTGRPAQAKGSIAPLASKELDLAFPATTRALDVTTDSSARLIVWISGDIHRLAPGRHHLVVPVDEVAQGRGSVIVSGGLKPARYAITIALR